VFGDAAQISRRVFRSDFTNSLIAVVEVVDCE